MQHCLSLSREQKGLWGLDPWDAPTPSCCQAARHRQTFLSSGLRARCSFSSCFLILKNYIQSFHDCRFPNTLLWANLQDEASSFSSGFVLWVSSLIWRPGRNMCSHSKLENACYTHS